VRLSVFSYETQRQALEILGKLAQKDAVHPKVREAALAIVSECKSRDDECELTAIYEAVKHGTPLLEGLSRGVRYVADPREMDHFTAPNRILEQCTRGICSEDCDGHGGLIAALVTSIGFRAGLRAWGPASKDGYTHVYAVVGVPKRRPSRVVALDTTVDEAYVGWEPPMRGFGDTPNILTAWLV